MRRHYQKCLKVFLTTKPDKTGSENFIQKFFKLISY